MENELRFKRIVALRNQNPKVYAFVRIRIAFENAESKAVEIRKKGKNETLSVQFKDLLSTLKKTIKQMKELFDLSNSEFDEWCRLNNYSPKLQFDLRPLSH